ncbi:stAR-related lipid transfer protein 7, mitochondrial [Octopus vulgaris]|uniref:StAR-related lipid transfer protein 7, mitochondrial n=1 Tax=Octopus vulgaris TaxID=6645 RepID=A0AA36BFH6_OCTVU|nr:stAR-related lipid transfer protein 7, mitochondrial [Octopus vulgaris]
MSSPEHIRRGMRTVFTHLIRSSVLTKVLSASIIKQSHTATTLSCRTNTAVSLFRKLSEKANAQLDILSTHFAKQCHAIVAQRVRRALQISNLYSRLYDQKSLVHMLTKLRNTILKHTSNKSLGFLLSASLFSWDKYRITDEEMQSVAEDISSANLKHMSSKELKALNWQKVIDQPNLEVWRKPIENSHLYQYKVHGSFYDIPASAFFVIQVDLNYRKIWDKLVIKLDIVDRDEESGSEIVHWITHFPYPMYSREYVYRRRFNEFLSLLKNYTKLQRNFIKMEITIKPLYQIPVLLIQTSTVVSLATVELIVLALFSSFLSPSILLNNQLTILDFPNDVVVKSTK